MNGFGSIYTQASVGLYVGGEVEGLDVGGGIVGGHDGSSDCEGLVDNDGSSDCEGLTDGTADGSDETVGSDEGISDRDGWYEGDAEGIADNEGIAEGWYEGDVEGITEGCDDGITEGWLETVGLVVGVSACAPVQRAARQ